MPDSSHLADDHDLTERGAELLKPSRGRNSIPRVVSLLVLVGVLVLTGLLFFRVMALFVVPLFLAAVLVVVFEPVFKWFRLKLSGRTALASLATTAVILLTVLIPCGVVGWRAYVEARKLLGDEFAAVVQGFTDDEGAVAEGEQPEGKVPIWNADFDNLEEGSRLHQFAKTYQAITHRVLDNAERDWLKVQGFGLLREQGPHSLFATLKATGAFVLGLIVMTVAVYYFFADGPAMVQTLMHLSPLDDAYEEVLLERFAEVSRAVVIATVLSAVVQGLLAGVGYWIVLDDSWPVFLLTVVTLVLAMVPFIGAVAVWAPVAIALFIQGHTFSAIGLAIYGGAIVSTIDNVIKPLVLHGRSNLHPLLALLSVLGGVAVLGPIGILVGPMLVAFLQALLTMLRKELDSLEEDEAESASESSVPEPSEPETAKVSDGEPHRV